MRQVKVAQNKIPLISPILQSGIESYLVELTQKIRTAVAATSNGKIPLSYDYVLLAENTEAAAKSEDAEELEDLHSMED